MPGVSAKNPSSRGPAKTASPEARPNTVCRVYRSSAANDVAPETALPLASLYAGVVRAPTFGGGVSRSLATSVVGSRRRLSSFVTTFVTS